MFRKPKPPPRRMRERLLTARKMIANVSDDLPANSKVSHLLWGIVRDLDAILRNADHVGEVPSVEKRA